MMMMSFVWKRPKESAIKHLCMIRKGYLYKSNINRCRIGVSCRKRLQKSSIASVIFWGVLSLLLNFHRVFWSFVLYFTLCVTRRTLFVCKSFFVPPLWSSGWICSWHLSRPLYSLSVILGLSLTECSLFVCSWFLSQVSSSFFVIFLSCDIFMSVILLSCPLSSPFVPPYIDISRFLLEVDCVFNFITGIEVLFTLILSDWMSQVFKCHVFQWSLDTRDCSYVWREGLMSFSREQFTHKDFYDFERNFCFYEFLFRF
jgi:hypothetical protein